MQIHSSSQGLIQQHSVSEQARPSSYANPNQNHSSSSSESTKELSSEEEQQVRKMRARDREVRAHEQAHKSAAGGLASGGVSFEYQTGPDGKQYAVGGEVKIDTSPVLGNPDATARKAEKIQRAATAPAEPSSQDLQVAAQAFAMEQEANAQKRKDKAEEAEGNDLGILKSGKEESTIDSTNMKASAQEKFQGTCEVCGGNHSGEYHTQNNIEKINEVFDLANVSEGRASIFSVIA